MKAGSIITIFTPISSASCGYTGFAVGKKFVIYGNRHNFYFDMMLNAYNRYGHSEISDTFWTNQCSRTTGSYQNELADLDKLYR